MSDIHPVLCWRMPDDNVVGLLVGSSLMISRDNERGVTTALAGELAQHNLEPVKEARLVRRIVDVRPAFRSGGLRFVSRETLPLPVDVVVTTTDSGYVAHLPRLDRSFGCADEDLIESLAHEEIVSWARDASSEQIHAELRVPPATLSTIPAHKRSRSRVAARDRQVPELLLSVADREPAKIRAGRVRPGAWGQESLVAQLVDLLLAGRNVVVVGEPSVGKSTLLREAIASAVEKSDPEGAGAKTFWRTTTHRIVAGARYLGEWQERADLLANAVRSVNGTLWVEDLLEMFIWGGTPEESIAAYWRPLLRRGMLPLLGELTPRARELVWSALPDVASTFAVLELPEMPLDAARAALDRYAGLAQNITSVEILPEARRRALRLLERFDRYSRFPGKAIRFADTLLQEAQQASRARVSDSDVIDAFERSTGLPRALVDDALPLSGQQIASALSARIVDQHSAVDAAVRVLLSWKAGLNDPDRPVATLLFAGPTGVGKTALASALASYCFGAAARRTPLVRVDMSELGTPWAVERFLGSRTQPGSIVAELRERPFAVLLLDEVEKAHPLFFDLLLSVLDEGRLVDALGRETDLRGTILVMTTNLGTKRGSSLGFGSASGLDTSAIRAFFRPEFYNRIDEVVPFYPLTSSAVAAIARRELSALEQREGFAGRAISLSFTDAVVDFVVRAGFDPVFGARPLQRAIEQHVVSALARLLVNEQGQELLATDLTVDVDGEQVVVRSREA